MPLTSSSKPADWYWIAKDGRIYSSKRQMLVYSYDAGYLAFVATKGAASPWPTDANGVQSNAALNAVLAFYGLPSGLN